MENTVIKNSIKVRIIETIDKHEYFKSGDFVIHERKNKNIDNGHLEIIYRFDRRFSFELSISFDITPGMAAITDTPRKIKSIGKMIPGSLAMAEEQSIDNITQLEAYISKWLQNLYLELGSDNSLN